MGVVHPDPRSSRAKASSDVVGGALIIVGEDYGVGASTLQERTLTFAMKSAMCLVESRANHQHVAHLVEAGFDLSEASHMPVLLGVRIRSGHMRDTMVCKANCPPAISMLRRLNERFGTGESDLGIMGDGGFWHSGLTTGVANAVFNKMETDYDGLKVVIARAECQLEKGRRERGEIARKLQEGVRVEHPRFGVDRDVCTGDHSCMRLNGCPSLALAPNPDPLRDDPIAHIEDSCVGCGLCGEVAHAVVLCPSFFEVKVVTLPGRFERLRHRANRFLIGLLMGRNENSSVSIRA